MGETVEERKARWRSVAALPRKTESKTVTHHTDTAIVTETHRDNSQDTNVRMLSTLTPRKDP